MSRGNDLNAAARGDPSPGSRPRATPRWRVVRHPGWRPLPRLGKVDTGGLTSALAARDEARFWAAVRGMLWLVGFAVPVYAMYCASRDAYANAWRRWLTRRFLDTCLSDRAFFRLAGVDNPDQRIADDVNTFTSRSLNFLLIPCANAARR